jgi:hypothetical protein
MWQSRIHTDIKKHLTPHSRRGRRSERQRAMFGLGTQRGGAKGGMVSISGLRLQFPRRPRCSFLQVFALFLLFLWPVTYLPPSPDRESWRWQDSALQFLARMECKARHTKGFFLSSGYWGRVLCDRGFEAAVLLRIVMSGLGGCKGAAPAGAQQRQEGVGGSVYGFFLDIMRSENVCGEGKQHDAIRMTKIRMARSCNAMWKMRTKCR